MAIMHLIDTNIFLEILLAQEKGNLCKKFLNANIGSLYISDFSLHSIGVILFRNNREESYRNFINDILPNIRIAALPKRAYEDLFEIRKYLGFDFDDAYQYGIAREYDLQIVTMDRDFEKADGEINIVFL